MSDRMGDFFFDAVFGYPVLVIDMITFCSFVHVLSVVKKRLAIRAFDLSRPERFYRLCLIAKRFLLAFLFAE